MASSGMLRLAIAFPHWSRHCWHGAFLGALGLAELGIGRGPSSPIPLATYGVGLVIDLLAAEASR